MQMSYVRRNRNRTGMMMWQTEMSII